MNLRLNWMPWDLKSMLMNRLNWKKNFWTLFHLNYRMFQLRNQKVNPEVNKQLTGSQRKLRKKTKWLNWRLGHREMSKAELEKKIREITFHKIQRKLRKKTK